MIKFFRKKMKLLLAVFGALLLIVWLGGSAFNQMAAPDYSKQVIADTNHGPIRELDRNHANIYTQMMSWFGMPYQAPMVWSMRFNPAFMRYYLPEDQISIMDWVLLQREVDRAGIVLKGQALDEALGQLGITPKVVRDIAVRQNITDERIKETLGQYIRLAMLLDEVSAAVVPGEAQLRVDARDLQEKVKINAVVLKAQTFKNDEQTFTEDQVEEQFEAYREETPRLGGLEFGYFQPAQVQVEYFKIEPKAIEPLLRASPAEILNLAKDYWRLNKEDRIFMKPPSTQPTTQPAPREQFATFTEAKEAAFNKVREMLANEAAEAIATAIDLKVADPWGVMTPKKNGYKPVPESVKVDGYCQTIKDNIPKNIAYPEAVSIHSMDWFNRKNAQNLAGIGKASVKVINGRPIRFSDLVFQVEGITEIPETGKVDRELFVAPYQFSSRRLKDAQGNIYIFRVTGIEPAHAPETSKIVKDEITKDLQLKAGFDTARTALEDLLAQTKEAGSLEAAWDNADNLKEQLGENPQGVQKDLTLTRKRSPYAYSILPGIGNPNEEFRKACFELKNKSGDGPKVAVLELPESATVALVEWVDEEPLTDAQYDEMRPRLLQATMFKKMEALKDYLEPKNIRERNDFKYRSKEKIDEVLKEEAAVDEEEQEELDEVEGKAATEKS